MYTQTVEVAAPSAATPPPATYAKITWRLLPFLFLCYVCAYLDRINVSFAKLQMIGDLGFSDAVYGIGAGLFFVTYLTLEVPSNLALLKVGARIWITRIMVSWGVVSVAMLFVRTPLSFYVMRLLLGAAEAGFFSAILFYLSNWFPRSRRSKITAAFLTALPASGLLGAPLSGWILSRLHHAGGLAGWQWLFLLEGLPAVVLGCAAFFYLDDSIEDARWLTRDEKALVKLDLARENGTTQLNSVRHGLLNPRVWMLSLTYLCFTMGLYGVSFWLPSIVKSSGVADPMNIGLLTAIPYGASMIAMMLVGHSSDATGERRWHIVVPAFVGALGLTASAAFASEVVPAMIGLTVGTLGVMATISQFWVLPPALLKGPAAASGIAVANAVGGISGVISPYLLGVIQTHTGSTQWGVRVMAAFLIVGSALVLILPARLVNSGRAAAV